MLQINEIGLIETWERKWWSKTSFCKGSLITEATPIGLIDVQSAFYLVFLGITLALLVLALEKLSAHFRLGTRIKEVFCKKRRHAEESSGRSPTRRTCDGVTVRQRGDETMVNGRPLGSEFQHEGMFYTESHDAREAHKNGRRPLGDEFRHEELFPSESSDPTDTHSRGRRPLGNEFRHEGMFPSDNPGLGETYNNGSVPVDRDGESHLHNRFELGTYFTYRNEAVNHDNDARDTGSPLGRDTPENEAPFSVSFAPSHERNSSSREASGRATPARRKTQGILKKKRKKIRRQHEVVFY